MSLSLNPLPSLAALNHYFSGLGAGPELSQMRALGLIDGVARRESFIIAFGDCFFLMGIAFLVALCLVLLLKRANAGSGALGAH